MKTNRIVFLMFVASCLTAGCGTDSVSKDDATDMTEEFTELDLFDISEFDMDIPDEIAEDPGEDDVIDIIPETGEPEAELPVDPWGEKRLLFGMAGHWWWLVDDALRARFIEEYLLLGATCIRLGLDWVQVEPDEATRDYSTFDAILPDFRDAGIEIVGLFYAAPSWAAVDGSWDPGDALRHDKIDAMASTARDLAAHFSYIKYWEFWNEPHGAMGDGSEFALWFTAFRDAVKEANPGALVSAGTTFSETDSTYNFVSSLYAALGSDRPDAIIVHPYRKTAHPPEINISQIEAIHSLDASVEIWITEYGWDTRGDFSWEEQSSGLLSALDWMSCQDYVRLANLHMLHDWGEDHEAHEGYGLVTREFIDMASFQRKDAWETFRAMRAGELPEGCRP